MTKYSDKFSSCARPEIQELIVVQGTRVQVAKLWGNYTDREKGLAMNYKFGCGAEIVEFLLHLEAELEQVKVQLAAIVTATSTTLDTEVNDNFQTIEKEFNSMVEATRASINRIDASLAQAESNFKNLDAGVTKVEAEVERRVTPEYIGRVEKALFTRLDEAFEAIKSLSDRVTAIDTAKS